MKKLLSILLAICLIVPCVFSMAGCKEEHEKVMNLELNPKLEFVLDKNDKIITVNALNDDGNQVLTLAMDSDLAFKNLTAEKGVELFLEIAKDGGYLITGSPEEIKIELSGSAEELKNKLKSTSETFFTENNLNVSIELDEIDLEDIKESVNECMKEYTDIELNAMSEEELIALLKSSRLETENLLSEELKNTYYNLRVEHIKTAELDELFAIIEALPETAKASLKTFTDSVKALKDTLLELEQAYVDTFLSAESAYAKAKADYLTAKQAFLDKRLEYSKDGALSTQEQLVLDGVEKTIALAETTLESAKETAELSISIAKGVVNSAIDLASAPLTQVKAILETLNVDINQLADSVNGAKADFKAYFEANENFSIYVAN